MEIPADLRLVEDFLNTLDQRSFRRHGVDLPGGEALPDPAALEQWLAAHGLVGAPVTASEADLRQAHDLRALLRAAVARTGLGDDVLRRANAALETFPVRVELTADGHFQVAAAADTVPGALTRLLAVAVRRGADGSWGRLRACASPDCQWVFYDDSRNGAGRWCSMSSCGNRTKTARYRARRSGDTVSP